MTPCQRLIRDWVSRGKSVLDMADATDYSCRYIENVQHCYKPGSDDMYSLCLVAWNRAFGRWYDPNGAGKKAIEESPTRTNGCRGMRISGVRCGRKAGHGRNGRYCWWHARQRGEIGDQTKGGE